MKILENYNDLVGKKIVFSHMAQFADQITLATEDGCVLMATMEQDDFEGSNEIRILYPHAVLNVLHKHEWMRKELGELGIFDVQKYEEEQRVKREKEKEEYRKKKEQKDREEYQRLKAKFGQEK